MKRHTVAVMVRIVKDPAGQLSVLLQLPPDTSWITTGADDARRIAATLLNVADELDEQLLAIARAQAIDRALRGEPLPKEMTDE
jgi:hypothetical protein